MLIDPTKQFIFKCSCVVISMNEPACVIVFFVYFIVYL